MFMLMLAIIAIYIIFLALTTLIQWTEHKDKTKDSYDIWGYGDYNAFLREFNKYYDDWYIKDFHRNSLIARGKKGYISIDSYIKFNNTGMAIRDPISYFKVQLFIKRHIKKLKNTTTYDWNTIDDNCEGRES